MKHLDSIDSGANREIYWSIANGQLISMARFEQTADLLSVIQTCRFQARSAMCFFREAISAHSCALAMPSLVPLF